MFRGYIKLPGSMQAVYPIICRIEFSTFPEMQDFSINNKMQPTENIKYT